MTISEIRAKNLTRSGSLFLISVGVLTLIGWAFDWRPILRWLPGSSLIICDSAFCLLLAGIGLFTAQRRSVWLPRIIGTLLFALGTAYFVNAIRQGNFTIHHFFPAATRAAIFPMPVHAFRTAMGPSLAFLLLGVLLILVTQKWPGKASFAIATVAAIAITAIGVLGVVVAFGGIAGDYGWSRLLLRMALPTAISTFVMGITCQSLLWVKLDATGPQLSSDAAYSALLGLLMLFGGVDSAIGIDANEAIKARNDLATATTRINLIRKTVAAIREAESGQRGFLLTGADDFLKAYREGSEEALADSDRLQKETPTAKALCEATQAKLAMLGQAIRLSQSGRTTEALATIRSRQGLFLMKSIDLQSNKLANDLEGDLRTHLNANEVSLQRVRRTIFISYALALLLSGFGFYLLRKESNRRSAVESELRESARTLETKVAVRTLEMAVKATKLKEEVERRIATEFELSQTGERLRASLRFAKMAAWTWDPSADKVTWSGPVKDIFGFDGLHLGSYAHFKAAIHPDDRVIVHDQIERCAREGCYYAAEFRIVRPNGDIRWVAGVGGAKFDLSGAVVQMAGVYFDISARKVAEQQLEIRERHFRELAEALPQIIWTADANGTFTYQNNRWYQLVGSERGAAATLQDWHKLIHPHDVDGFLRTWSEAVGSDRACDVECRLQDASRQEYRWHLVRSVPVLDSKGAVAHWLGSCTDIHERKQAEIRLAENAQALEKREQQLALLFATGMAGDWTVDLRTQTVTAHPAVWALYGETVEHRRSAPGSWFSERWHPLDAETNERTLQTAYSTGGLIQLEFRVVRPDGTLRWLEGRGVVIHDQHGTPVQAHGLDFDITERKTSELLVRESEKHFRQLAEAMPQMVWRATPDGDLDYCNARFTQYTGYSLDDLRVHGCNSLVHPQDLADYIRLRAEGFTSGEPFELEYRLRRASDGAYRWFLTRSIPYQDEPHTLIHWFGTSTDIHEQKIAKDRLEEEVVKRTAELERSLDQLARSLREKETLLKEVHHRVKNNLQIISSLLRMQGHSVSDQRAASALQDSRQRVLSMALVHERLYGNQQMDRVDFADYSQTLVNELFSSFYFEKAGRITARFNLSHVQLAIDQAIPCGLILNELVTNALKYAYPGDAGGEISIDLVETEEGLVTLSVADQGIGLPEAFDWKDSKSMGLPIVDILATQIGGSFTVESNNGARFSVTFARECHDAKAASAA